MTNYTLIDKSGVSYITPLDRRALSAMLEVNAMKAHTARKDYTIKLSGKLPEITDALSRKANDPRALSFERQSAERMLNKAIKEERAGRIFWELHAIDKTYHAIYYFFA